MSQPCPRGGETYDHVHLPVDGPQQSRDKQCQQTVPNPVGRRRQRDGLGANLGRENLGRICPASGTDCGRKGTHEEIGKGDNGFPDSGMCGHGPGDGIKFRIRAGVGCAESSLQTTLDVEEDGLAGKSNQKGFATPKFVQVDDRRQCECRVQDVLDRCRQERRPGSGTLHDIHCPGISLLAHLRRVCV